MRGAQRVPRGQRSVTPGFGPTTRATADPAGQPRRLLFLDFDGVLLTTADRAAGIKGLEPAKVQLLATLVADTGASIVVSSAWRTNVTAMRSVLQQAGLRGARRLVIGITPRVVDAAGAHAERGAEIQAWLDQFGSPDDVIGILDDDDDMGALGNRLVQTDLHRGLTAADAARLIALLLDAPIPDRQSSPAPAHDEGGRRHTLDDNAGAQPWRSTPQRGLTAGASGAASDTGGQS